MLYNCFGCEIVIFHNKRQIVAGFRVQVSEMEVVSPRSAIITNIQGFSIHDGPGIRTVVFFKGCPLSCQWCANPECLSMKPQMGFIKSLCTECGRCMEVCENKAICRQAGAHRVDYSRCTACGKCKDHCYYGALIRYGSSMTVAEVWDAVRRDKMFYDTSGGGITVSGGEPMLWSKFIRELFELSHTEQIDTCMETCGLADPEALLDIIPVTDHFLFDLKHMDAEVHKKYTGQTNSQILKNAALLMEHGADVVFRQPLIPGINDSLLNIEAIAGFLNGLGKNAIRLQIMPYHRMGQSKYEALNMQCIMDGRGMAEDEQVEAAKKAYIDHGLDCTISR
jgi:pyruvate formate lyase activating enzyme